MDKITCKICDKAYSKMDIHTHMARSHGSVETKAKYSSGNNGKYTDIECKKLQSNKAKDKWLKIDTLPIVSCSSYCGL